MEIFLPEIGFISLLLALCITSYHTLLGFIGVFQHVPRQISQGVLWISLQFACLLVAFLCLTASFVLSDFSVVYVAQHSHSLSPLMIKIAAVWGGHEGSLLLWVLFFSGWSTLFAWRYRRQNSAFFPLTLCLLTAICTALLLFVVFYSNPFERLFPPAIDGRDLNPMLQHWGLILHPPLLYLGYSGFMLVAALVLAALIAPPMKQPDDASQTIAQLCWRFAVPSWCILTSGIILGSWWAYSELGWGGWWFWDPVENASLLPWLSATALLHSLSLTRRTGRYRHWSMLLAIMTLILALLGTLIVRSGILISVHAFALDNVRAAPLFLLFSFLSLGALFIYGWKAKFPPRDTQRKTSREIYLLLTLIVFTAVLGIVLTGTLYPMIYGLLGLGKISVGAPYFNQALLPFGLIMLVLIVISTFGYRHITHQGHHTLRQRSLLILNQKLPVIVSHTGVILFAIGLALSATQKTEISQNIAVGQSIFVGGYQFQFKELQLSAESNYTTEKAIIHVSQNSKNGFDIITERRLYMARQQLMIEPGISWGWLRSWYVVLGEKTGDDRYAMRFYVQEGIQWIWGGGFIMCIGVLIGWFRERKHA
ncbi:heme lyase CcmF/NrfE family subunit [Providencia alcalifaciens]|uniref:heme lyase CcmF/NrfE family subunit n=1 Tax=Providencia alcalifaciens TaxID=126385 RepID=UPI00044EB3E7|nr:heme lyase CcmF/NrfE family subunit [Providencia alcalifaciens]ETT07117.1 putative cytochrome c-type biogenesis protein CcmF [Providencia alcalifaciens F90-2004]EUC96570.1 putative cytochrome c-type biogenesis protein CcmF [Providencia alcalifaciens PAL-2]MTB32677.1 heme lyase NrfEFG subunit NrfE [Providencia alcalifaciens]MTC98165.1 heme lyase NrfEFG subunit NrfE [Providencia alcalifaciens]